MGTTIIVTHYLDQIFNMEMYNCICCKFIAGNETSEYTE